VAQTLTAIAALLWPLLLLGVILIFRAPLVGVVKSAQQREWTLEVGGQKISMKQLSEQQNGMIADLQKQVAALNQAVAALTASTSDGAPPREILEEAPASAPPINSVLWVDDHPENNAILVEQLQRNGVRVDLARDTEEGLALLGQRRYAIVVSDMGRNEHGTEVSDAGLRLLSAVRSTDPSIPFVIYCSVGAARRYRDRALAAGATAITSSPVSLSTQLAALELL
jgi:CheY-like chemotaxis protein